MYTPASTSFTRHSRGFALNGGAAECGVAPQLEGLALTPVGSSREGVFTRLAKEVESMDA
jgi:hypothetical protein